MNHARINIADVIIIGTVSIAALAMAPSYYGVIDKLAPGADPLSSLLLQLVVPFIFIGIIISTSVSARRRV